MHRMTGYDAQFIYDEAPNEPQHTLKLLILDETASRAYSFESAKASVGRRLSAVPVLGWRALRVPFGLHHPLWISDEEPDLGHHLRRAALPSPGGHGELCELVSEIASTPLDPDRPLWEIWFLEGFEGGKVVTVLKISHALADGGSTKELLEAAFPNTDQGAGFLNPAEQTGQNLSLLDGAQSGSASGSDGAYIPADRTPGRRELVRSAILDLGRDWFVRIPRLVAQAYRARRARREAKPVVPGPQPLSAPRNFFGGPLSRRRRFFFITLPLARAKMIKSRFGVTVNDVLLATVAGATARYLRDRDEPTSEPMLGGMAASTRSDEHRGRFGNRLTSEFLWLPIEIDDPVERLHAAARYAAEAKQRIASRKGIHPESWIELLPPILVRTISSMLRLLARYANPPGSVFVSNVAGPREPLLAGEGKIENFVSVGHMKFIASLNVTVWSYADKLNFALYACARTVPDLAPIARYLDAAFEELFEAAMEDAGMHDPAAEGGDGSADRGRPTSEPEHPVAA